MSLSIVNNHTAVSVESARAATVLPPHLREGGIQQNDLLKLIYSYYQACNDSIAARGIDNTFQINNMVRNHDIDLAHDVYLAQIKQTIARNVPNSRALDRRRLLKIIAQFYLKRGSEASFYDFFRIFYDQSVLLFYPKRELLNSSSDRSVISNIYKTLDSYYWQDYSYVVKVENDDVSWLDDFVRFMHPAGLKLFYDLTIFALAGSLDTQRIYNSYADIDDQIRICTLVGMPDNHKHYLTHIRQVVNSELRNLSSDQLRAFYIYFTLQLCLLNSCDTSCNFYEWYVRDGKYADPAPFLYGYQDLRISDTWDILLGERDPRPYSPTAHGQFKGYGARLTRDTYTYGATLDTDSDVVWIASYSSPPDSPALNSPSLSSP